MRINKVIGAMLILCFAIFLMSFAAYAAGIDRVQLSIDAISGYDNGYSYIYYGSHNGSSAKWQISKGSGIGLVWHTDEPLTGEVVFDENEAAAVTEKSNAGVGMGRSVKLDNDRIFFLSPADNSAQRDFGAQASYSGREWKLTLKDDDIFSGAYVMSGSGNLPIGYSAETFVIAHDALKNMNAGYTHITAMLTDTKGKVLYYGAINSDVNAVSSQVTIEEGLREGTYTLAVFGEARNGARETDHASRMPFNITITVGEVSSSGISGNAVQSADADETAKTASRRSSTAKSAGGRAEGESSSSASVTSTKGGSVSNTSGAQTEPENKVTGITEGQEYLIKSKVTFTANGAGMDNDTPKQGDVRWLPAKWYADSEGSFGESYTQSLDTTGMFAGKYTLTVTFEEQVWNGNAWNGTGAVDNQQVGFVLSAVPSDGMGEGGGDIIPTDTDSAGLENPPKTEDAGQIGIWIIFFTAILGWGLMVKIKKQKKTD